MSRIRLDCQSQPVFLTTTSYHMYIYIYNIYIKKFGQTRSISYGSYFWEGRIREGGFNFQLYRFLYCLTINMTF